MIEAVGATDVGRRRKLNEDNYLVESEGLRRLTDATYGSEAE